MVSPISYGSCISQTNFMKVESNLAIDQLKAILKTERKYQVPRVMSPDEPEHLNNHNDEWRKKICEWSFKVIDHFKIDREIVSVAMNILDRYVAKETSHLQRNSMDVCEGEICTDSVDSRVFQLAAMTSLYLAIKLCDNDECQYSSSRNLRLNYFVELSRGQFSADDITEMECSILCTLQWEVFPPTPMATVSYLLLLMPLHDNAPFTCNESSKLVLHVLHELARYLTELSVCHGRICAAHTSSQIAYASILLSMELLTPVALPQHMRDTFNDAVSSISLLAGGTALSCQDDRIRYLKEALRESFWPEMLVDDCEYAEVGHPISMAKDFGLLNTSYISSPHNMFDTNGTSHVQQWGTVSSSHKDESKLQDSPVCVNRHY